MPLFGRLLNGLHPFSSTKAAADLTQQTVRCRLSPDKWWLYLTLILMMMMFRICLLDAANSRVPQQFSPLRRTNRNMIRMDNKNSGKVWSDLRSRRRMQKNKTRRGQWTTTGHLPFNLRFSGSSGGFFRHTNSCELRNMTCGVSILKVIKENQKKRILMPPLFKGRTHFGKNKGRDLLSCCWCDGWRTGMASELPLAGLLCCVER